MTKITILITCFLSFYSSVAQLSKVKAGFIYHFTKYIEYPESKRYGDFVIAIVGKTDVTSFLEVLALSKRVGTQNIVIKEFKTIEDVTKCHILYLPSSESKSFNLAVIKGVYFNSLLIVEKSGLGKMGACINFIVDNNKAKFEINTNAIKKSNLKIDNKLISLGLKIN